MLEHGILFDAGGINSYDAAQDRGHVELNSYVSLLVVF